jgi:predicted permease
MILSASIVIIAGYWSVSYTIRRFTTPSDTHVIIIILKRFENTANFGIAGVNGTRIIVITGERLGDTSSIW